MCSIAVNWHQIISKIEKGMLITREALAEKDAKSSRKSEFGVMVFPSQKSGFGIYSLLTP